MSPSPGSAAQARPSRPSAASNRAILAASPSSSSSSSSSSSLGNQSHLERLPTELLIMVAKEAQNPWLGYVSRQFYQNLVTKRDRRALLNKAFRTFGLRYPIANRWQHRGKQTYRDYMEVFMEIVELPWFWSACFSSDRRVALIIPSKIKKWALKSHGICAMFDQPVWTQKLGEFVAEVLRRWPVILTAGTHAYYHYQRAVVRALKQGCLPALQVLSDFDLTEADYELDCYYEQDIDLPNSQWIQRWKTQKPGAVAPVFPVYVKLFYAPIVAAMALTRLSPEPCKYQAIANAYVDKFWNAIFAEHAAQNSAVDFSDDAQDPKSPGALLVRAMHVLFHRAYKGVHSNDRAIRVLALKVYRAKEKPLPILSGWKNMELYNELFDVRDSLRRERQAFRAIKCKYPRDYIPPVRVLFNSQVSDYDVAEGEYRKARDKLSAAIKKATAHANYQELVGPFWFDPLTCSKV